MACPVCNGHGNLRCPWCLRTMDFRETTLVALNLAIYTKAKDQESLYELLEKKMDTIDRLCDIIVDLETEKLYWGYV